MRILKVIHGYPRRYNAGSEVYSQTLCQALAARHEVHVFTREENPFAPPYALSEDVDPDDSRVRLHVVNVANFKDRYRHVGLDAVFEQVLGRVRPDVVHVGHLNHLSTSLVERVAAAEIPIVFTLHDYWLMCPRGQFMQMFPADPTISGRRATARTIGSAPSDATHATSRAIQVPTTRTSAPGPTG
jgi:glycosyltransferase involved in cell wall biosynthesis